jgi:phosphatidylcholine synthase
MNFSQTLFIRQLLAWSVHAFTASGSIIGIFALDAIYNHHYLLAIWLMWIAIGIDAVDGTLARKFHVKAFAPQLDGALLDNIVDYINYVFVPASFILLSDLLPYGLRSIVAAIILLSSAYQFCQENAKTQDHFFKGFPSYWNITVFYLFFSESNPWLNLFILLFLAGMVFVPIKYVYPSRLDYLTNNLFLRKSMLIATVAWGIANIGLLCVYPASSTLLLALSLSYMILYVSVSLYRTFIPLKANNS